MTDKQVKQAGILDETQRDMHGQTAIIDWLELQRFFAAGKVLFVVAELNLVEVAAAVTKDDTVQVERWMQAGQLARVTDAQATEWQVSNPALWSVVVAPWVLVQSVTDANTATPQQES